MRNTFNLISDPWLPVRRRSGVVEFIEPWRVAEGFDSDPCVAFAWPRPDFNGAAHEFLIGLLSTAATPRDEDDWCEWWDSPPSPEVLRRRLAAVVHAFDLNGDSPRFMQDFDTLENAKTESVSALLIETPGAQTLRKNADLFVKRGGVPVLSRAATAMALFTLNAFAPSGGAGHRTSMRGGGPMTTLVSAEPPGHGPTLWGRLWPNVETIEQIDARADRDYSLEDFGSIFPWLTNTRVSDPKAGGRETTPRDVHPLQVYWGMPRRIRVNFEAAAGRNCGLTGDSDLVVAENYRTRNYGTNYSDGFEHPLSPYYRQNPKDTVWLPVHPKPGGLNYRLWPGLVVDDRDKTRRTAKVLSHWRDGERGEVAGVGNSRILVFGYDMDNMKARAWIEGEMPLWLVAGEFREYLDHFIQRAVAGANMVSRLLIGAIKSALFDRPKDAVGDYGFIGEKFFRETEGEFYYALRAAIDQINSESDVEDRTVKTREDWVKVLRIAALRLFDEHAPGDGLEDRNMQRHVKARFQLAITLRGGGKSGKSLYDGDLQIPSPETIRRRTGKTEAA